MISNRQFGFQQSVSIQYAICHLTQKIDYYLDKKKLVAMRQ